ncbi:hypothetical protein AKJ51_04565 [candidate division MSBL1 archaeon SCGC-AAA382A20]|uniref:Cation/H+ exchanger transmembrane domain-containing protein n=1 Tax=candidate division MSBL1 archaeon SCGC-AAA382A20 TaxID=1698280 RepID=A0A133VHG9_9EURY|nr:hypothetical protein AKJ51_04565 [candidate division MSBL1 archaeon SCGC-AAA382A20]
MALEITFIPALLLTLLAASFGRVISLKVNQPEILGELILGVILGNFIVLAPSAQGPVADVAEIGILLLLFLSGLDLNFERFKESLIPSSGVATGGIVLPFLLGYLTCIYFNFSYPTALFIGASLVATSVGISASILYESGRLNTRLGALIMDSAVADDVIGVIMMTVLFSISTTGSLHLQETVLLIFFTILFFALSLTFGIEAIKAISERIPIEKENLLIGGLVLLLSFALITQKIGLAPVIGAFVAGLVIGQTQYVESLKNSVSLIGNGFFIPIFFVTTGMKFNLNELASVGLFALIILLMAVLGKVIGCSVGAKLFKFSNEESLATGIAMVPRAEVALIIAHFGLDHDIFGSDIFSVIVTVTLITTLLTPPFLWRIMSKI